MIQAHMPGYMARQAERSHTGGRSGGMEVPVIDFFLPDQSTKETGEGAGSSSPGLMRVKRTGRRSTAASPPRL